MTIQQVWARTKAKLRDIKEGFNDWVDEKVTDFVMNHLNLEETILCATAKAARDKFHLTSLLLLAAYYVWRLENWFKNLMTRKSKHELENV